MPELGGPANIAGINYQKSVTALFMGRMLDLSDRHPKERVSRVGTETGDPVDDICVTFADGHKRFIQVKLSLRASGQAWETVWQDFASQLTVPRFQGPDRLCLVLGTHQALGATLMAICEVAANSGNANDFRNRLNLEQYKRVGQIAKAIQTDPHDFTFWRRFFSKLDIEIWPVEALERDYVPMWIPSSSVAKTRLYRHLINLAQSGAARRLTFAPDMLRQRLKTAYSIDIADPSHWGSEHYRKFVKDSAKVMLPGTSIARDIDGSFVWSPCRHFDMSRARDVDDETPRLIFGIRPDEIDLSSFPTEGLDRVILTGGPGLGKTVLTKALSKMLVDDELLPVTVPVTSFCDTQYSLLEYLNKAVNSDHNVNIHWERAAETGLLVLIVDGLDEVADASRVRTIEAINIFASRYPHTPFLITVRDAAALPLPVSATPVEVQPLDEQDILDVLRFYRPEDESLCEQFIRQLRSKPDIRRFARIPLFLALMSPLVNKDAPLPETRVDILESFLDILFRPEAYKPSIEAKVDATDLRLIAQHAADISLRAGSIGISTRELTSAIKTVVSEASSTSVIQQLVACGVISRDRPGRYYFPFPILQEYLASAKYESKRIDDMLSIVESAAKRPWVQTLQFALERSESGDRIAAKILQSHDDAFLTKLRLLARCVSNGMKVSNDIRTEIAEVLAAEWTHSSYRIRSQVGELIADAFCIPLIPAIKSQLTNRYLLGYGSGRVIARQMDPALTRDIFAQMINGDLDYFYHLNEFRQPVREISDQAFELLLNRYRQEPGSRDVIDSISSLIRDLDGAKIGNDKLSRVVENDSLPLSIRLAALTKCASTTRERFNHLITEGLFSENDTLGISVHALLKCEEPARRLAANLDSAKLSDDTGCKLLDAIPTSIHKAIARDSSLLGRLRQSFRLRVLVFAAASNDTLSMEELAENSSNLPVDVLSMAISILGCHRCKKLANAFANGLATRVFNPTERVTLARSICMGMTARLEIVGWQSSIVHRAPLHPGFGEFEAILDRWSALEDYDTMDALDLDRSLAQFGDISAASRLNARLIAALEDPSTVTTDEMISHDLGHTLDVMIEQRIPVDIALIERVVRETGFNGKTSAYHAIAAQGTLAALNRLIEEFHCCDYHLRGVLLDLMEPLAARLGVRVETGDDALLRSHDNVH